MGFPFVNVTNIVVILSYMLYTRKAGMYISPRATMFIWAQLPAMQWTLSEPWSSRLIAREMLNRAGVAVIPGDAFGEQGEGYVRIALVENEQRLIEAAQRMGGSFVVSRAVVKAGLQDDNKGNDSMFMQEDKQNKLLLVDGMALLFRAFFANSYGGSVRRTSTGVPVNAIYGFIKYFMDAIQKFEPTHVVCCWDMGSTTFRTAQYDGYKANRPSAPVDLVPQFDLIKEVMESFGVPNIGMVGYEADDCIGTLAKRHSHEAHVYVLSGDHDLLQLVDVGITVVIMKKGQGNYAVYTPESLHEERQLTPQQIICVKGLMGDSSDNYPGVKGIGEKTAHKLVQEYGSVEGILANLNSLTKTIRAKIEADVDMLHLSRDLATIRCDVPVEIDFKASNWSINRALVMNKFEELEFRSLMTLIS